jgi:hypothetical protein
MARNALERSMEAIEAVWGPLTTELIEGCRGQLESLVKAPASEEWLASLHRDAPVNRELHRHPRHGFVLLAHTEHEGLYRPPPDHGRGWVIYAIQHGEIEMGTYARIDDPHGSVRLVRRGTTLVRPGQVQVYLPGDIHDTRCVRGPALLFRFTERDLKKEDQQEHRVTRYLERNGAWTARSA